MTQNGLKQSDVRSPLWYLLHDAERESRYYGRLADRSKKWHSGLSITTMVLSLLAGVTLFIPVEHWVLPYATASLFLAVSSLTAIAIVYDYSGRATSARIASDLIRGLCTEAKQAWYRGPETNLPEYVNALERRLDALTRVDLTVDDKLNKQCADDAYEVLRNELNRRGAGTSVTAES